MPFAREDLRVELGSDHVQPDQVPGGLMHGAEPAECSACPCTSLGSRLCCILAPVCCICTCSALSAHSDCSCAFLSCMRRQIIAYRQLANNVCRHLAHMPNIEETKSSAHSPPTGCAMQVLFSVETHCEERMRCILVFL